MFILDCQTDPVDEDFFSSGYLHGKTRQWMMLEKSRRRDRSDRSDKAAGSAKALNMEKVCGARVPRAERC
jgi:hypothetical protein